MDFMKLKARIQMYIGKYKYVLIVLLAGVVLMMLPEKNTNQTQNTPKQTPDTQMQMDMENRLEKILSCLNGAGKVRVMLAVSQGERIIYQTDSNYSQSENNTDTRTQTILITDSQRNETGLVHQKNPPTYQGAIILAQGADDPSVRLAIVEAVSDVTDLGADRISVFKMQ